MNARTKLTAIVVLAILSILGLQAYSLWQERNRAIDAVRAQAESAATAAAVAISSLPETERAVAGDPTATYGVSTALLRAQTISGFTVQTALVVPRPRIEPLEPEGLTKLTGDVVAAVGEPTPLLSSGTVALDDLPIPSDPRFSGSKRLGKYVAAVATADLARSQVAYVIVLASWEETALVSGAVAVLLTSGAAAVLLFLAAVSRGFTRRLEQLAHAAKRFGEGDLGYRVAVQGKDEIAALGEAFNQMAEALQSNRTALAEAVSDLAQTSAELEKQADENRRLLELTVDAVDEERTRLATELHDSTIQSLHRAAMEAEYVQMLAARGRSKEAADSAHKLTERLRDTADELRRILFDLRPPALDSRGLLASLESRLKEAEEVGGLSTNLSVQDGLEIPRDKEAVIYRFCQEAVANAVKHSSAKSLSIRLWKSGSTLRAEVKDDGKGFRLDDTVPPGHFGLVGIKDRAKLAGGKVSIRSAPGQGTRLELVLPLRASEKDEANAEGEI